MSCATTPAGRRPGGARPHPRSVRRKRERTGLALIAIPRQGEIGMVNGDLRTAMSVACPYLVLNDPPGPPPLVVKPPPGAAPCPRLPGAPPPIDRLAPPVTARLTMPVVT